MAKFFKWVLIIIAGLVIIGILFGDNEADAPQEQAASTVNEEPPAEEPPDLEVLEYDSERDEHGTLYITGRVKNNTPKTYGYVQVQINLYDESGAQVGSTMDNTNNLEPQGTWRFRAIALEDDAARYKIKDVTGF